MNKLENINKKIDELKKEIMELEEKRNEITNFTSIIITKVDITLKDLQNIQNKIKEIVELDGDFQNLGIKKLAYEIRKQNEGYYMQFDFIGVSEDFAELEKYYRLENNIIKFLNIRKDED